MSFWMCLHVLLDPSLLCFIATASGHRRAAVERGLGAFARDKDSLGPRDEDSLGPRDEDSLGPRDEDSLGPRDEDSLGPRDEDSLGPRDEDSLGPRDEDSLGPRDEDSLGPRDEDSLGPDLQSPEARPRSKAQSLLWSGHCNCGGGGTLSLFPNHLPPRIRPQRLGLTTGIRARHRTSSAKISCQSTTVFLWLALVRAHADTAPPPKKRTHSGWSIYRQRL